MFREHNILATFGDLDRARGAILSLERAGIEGSHVSLLARDNDVDPDVDESPDTRERDRELGADVAKRAAAGGAAGTAAGGAAGFLAGLAAFSIPGVGPVVGAGIWASTIGGAIGGGAVGGVAGGVSGLGTSEAFQRTYAAVDEDRVVVGVHHDDASIVEEAERALRDEEPDDLERYDAEGRRRS